MPSCTMPFSSTTTWEVTEYFLELKLAVRAASPSMMKDAELEVAFELSLMEAFALIFHLSNTFPTLGMLELLQCRHNCRSFQYC